MKIIKYEISNSFILFQVILLVLILFGCNPNGPDKVSSINDVEIIELDEGAVITNAEFMCSKVDLGDDVSVTYNFAISQNEDFSVTGFNIVYEWRTIGCSELYQGQWFIKVQAKSGDGDWGDWSQRVAFTAESSVKAEDVVITKVSDNELKADWPDVESAEYYGVVWGDTTTIYDVYNRREPTVSEEYFWIAGVAASWSDISFRVGVGEYGVLSELVNYSNE